MRFPPILRCNQHQQPLTSPSIKGAATNGASFLTCPLGCRFPIIGGIPRFVDSQHYTSGFGAQWNAYRTAQLDSFTGLTISRDRLARLSGGSLDIFQGKQVLEAGCGAGRFTEILLANGADVFAVDLSEAVAANYQNFAGCSNYFVCQADILNLPVEPEQFDIVVCIGVIQHTPNPEATMSSLCSYLKPGGLLIMDHYTYGYPATPSRRRLRAFLLYRSPLFALRFCQTLTAGLWPLHRLAWHLRNTRPIWPVHFARIRYRFLHLSPVVDYHDAYPRLGPNLLRQWAMLDTHDTLTDVFKHLRSAEGIARHLQTCGMIDIETVYAGNGVEARARKTLENPAFTL